MFELIVALGALLVLLYFSQDPPPKSTDVGMEMVQIPFAWMDDDDDSSYGNVDASDQHSTHTESEGSVQKDDCFQEFLSAPQTQHFPSATEK